MTTTQTAAHLVQILAGKTQARKYARLRAEQQRQADHTRPKWWIHARINTRARHGAGELLELVKFAHDNPAHLRDWHEYLNEARQLRASA